MLPLSLVFTMTSNAWKTESIAEMAHSLYMPNLLCSFKSAFYRGGAAWEPGVAFLLAPYGLPGNIAVGYWIEF